MQRVEEYEKRYHTIEDYEDNGQIRWGGEGHPALLVDVHVILCVAPAHSICSSSICGFTWQCVYRCLPVHMLCLHMCRFAYCICYPFTSPDSYIKLINVGHKVISCHCTGYLPSQVYTRHKHFGFTFLLTQRPTTTSCPSYATITFYIYSSGGHWLSGHDAGGILSTEYTHLSTQVKGLYDCTVLFVVLLWFFY